MESDIPGNRPEDLRDEAFINAIDKYVFERKIGPLPEDWQDNEALWELVIAGRDLGYIEGFNDGKQEAYIEEASKHLD